MDMPIHHFLFLFVVLLQNNFLVNIQVAQKYPTDQNAISQQPCETYISKFLHLYRRNRSTILEFFLNKLF